MSQHIVSSFDTDLETLRSRIAEMGGIAEKMLGDATLALVRRDVALAQSIIASDARLDALQRDLEEKAILTIARRQPMAVDLREVISVIRVAGDLERVGDLAKNTAKRVVAISGELQPLETDHLHANARGQQNQPRPRAGAPMCEVAAPLEHARPDRQRTQDDRVQTDGGDEEEDGAPPVERGNSEIQNAKFRMQNADCA